MGRKGLSSEEARRIGALGAAAWKAKLEAEKLPPEGWPSWPAYRRYLEDADGGRAPYRHTDIFDRTYLEAASENP
jgi:hypothetical protein